MRCAELIRQQVAYSLWISDAAALDIRERPQSFWTTNLRATREGGLRGIADIAQDAMHHSTEELHWGSPELL
jgi:hypothetical protein